MVVAMGCSASTEVVQLDLDAAAVRAASSGDASAAQAGGEQTAVQVFETVEDSVVFLRSPEGNGSGSGIVLDGGWVLTNAHVVERHGFMRIARSDGQDLGLAPVYAVDWVFDLALIGPVDNDSLVPIQRGQSSELAVGSRAYLVGFPDEVSDAPTPTMTEGIVSRRRFVAIGDYPFLQVDATIAPGQSGGALVNGKAELVGISGIEFGEGEFGLAFAADAMWARVDSMAAADPDPELADMPVEPTLSGQVGPLQNFSFLVEVDETGFVDLDLSSAADIWVDFQDLSGVVVSQIRASDDPFRGLASGSELYFDDLAAGGEQVVATVEPGMYQVLVGSFGEEADAVEVTSVNPLRAIADIEEGATLPVGQVVEGNLNWVRDTDTWQLPVEQGQRVSIVADGLVDTVLAVRLDGELIAMSDDEGLGLYGYGSALEFVADASATYDVEVGTYDQVPWGYLIQVTVS